MTGRDITPANQDQLRDAIREALEPVLERVAHSNDGIRSAILSDFYDRNIAYWAQVVQAILFALILWRIW